MFQHRIHVPRRLHTVRPHRISAPIPVTDTAADRPSRSGVSVSLDKAAPSRQNRQSAKNRRHFSRFICRNKKIVLSLHPIQRDRGARCGKTVFGKDQMVDVAQLVRVTDCGSEGRGFESLLPPIKKAFGWPNAFLLPREIKRINPKNGLVRWKFRDKKERESVCQFKKNVYLCVPIIHTQNKCT